MASVVQTRGTTATTLFRLRLVLSVDTQLCAYGRFAFKLWLWDANTISAAVLLLFIVSVCIVISVVDYLILEETREMATGVILVSALCGYSMVLYIVLIFGGAVRRLLQMSKAKNDARREAEAEV